MYKYSFNGKENDNEVKGSGNQQDYGLRIYDPRLGRFLSVDPLTVDYPWYTPYQFAGNTPIRAVDLDGGEEKIMVYKWISDGTVHRTILWKDIFPGQRYGPKGAGTDYYEVDEKTGKPYYSRHVTSAKEEAIRLDYEKNMANRGVLFVKNEPGYTGANTDTPTGEFDGNTKSVMTEKGGSSGGADRSEQKSDFPSFNIKSIDEKKNYDKEGFFKLKDKTWQKNFLQGKIYKSENNKDTTVVWSELGKTKKYSELNKEELNEIKSWTPEKTEGAK